MHPFTCRGEFCKRTERKDQGILVPAKDGMVCPCGKYAQNWVHGFMVAKQPSRGYWSLKIPLLGNAEFKLTIKWKDNFQNFTRPWLGVGIYPKKFKIREK